MESICGSEFWNFSRLWQDSDPDFTECFERTVLVWAPCGFLWCVLPMEYLHLKNSLTKSVPWSTKNVSKLALTLVLIALTITDIFMASLFLSRESFHSNPVDFITPIVKITTFMLAGTLTYYNKLRGQRTSGALFLFWLLLALCAIPQMRTDAKYLDRRKREKIEDPWADYQLISFSAFFAISWVFTLVSCFADTEPKVHKLGRQKYESPELGASFPSRLLFGFFDKTIWKSYRVPFRESDIWDLKYEDTTVRINPRFQGHWNNSLKKLGKVTCANLETHPVKGQDKASPVQLGTSEEQGDGAKANGQKANGHNLEGLNATQDGVKNERARSGKSKKEASILPAIIKSFGAAFSFSVMLKLISDVLLFLNPALLKAIIAFAQSNDPLWKGIFFAVALFANSAINSMMISQQLLWAVKSGIRVKTALVSLIYRKSLVLSSSARRDRTVGEIVNLMAVDTNTFFELSWNLPLLWSTPLQIGLCIFFLWQLLGPSVLVGLATMVALIPINALIATKTKSLHARMMKFKDKRVKVMNEVLNGIKVLKLYAWEPSFEEKVLEVRGKEIDTLRSAAYLGVGFTFIWSCASYLVALATFTTYVLSSPDNVLDAQKAFVSLSLFNILRGPFKLFPSLISNLIQTYVSMKRINSFLNSEELDPNNVGHNQEEAAALIMKGGTFQWDDNGPVLKDINLQVKQHQLVAVVGPVGCGKSSLISAFLGEMERISGRVNQKGSVAYVAQQAWIQNASLRDNILFGRPFEQQKYDRIIEACALVPDFEALPAGDQTEIGEKGINLSGGQKQRVSLARAAYQDADVYYLDDPLSAVDALVGKHIFQHVIGPEGLLATKTRLLVTHGITYLPKMDNIFVLLNGKLTESGTYHELVAVKGAFSEFLKEYETNPEEDVTHDLDSETLRRRKSAREVLKPKDVSAAHGAKLANGKQDTKDDEQTDGRKIIKAEKAEVGKVNWSVYVYYFKNIGYGLASATLVMLIISQLFAMGSNVWLSQWSTDPRAAEPKWRNIYLGGYGAFGVGQALFLIAGSFIFKTAAVAAAAKVHALLLSNIIHCPMSFFDTTPLGRILSRFSSDMQSIDQTVPQMIEEFFTIFLLVMSIVIIICAAVPWFTVVVVPLGIVYYLIQNLYISTSRQLKRLESTTRSPIYSHFGETLVGVSTIRAYRQEHKFVAEIDAKVDHNQAFFLANVFANRWVTIRLEFVGGFVVLFAALFAVLGRSSDSDLNAGLVGLSVSYAMQITQNLGTMMRIASNIEKNIVSVERVKEYQEVEQEAAWTLKNDKTPKQWPGEGAIEFKDYQVRYRRGLDLVLKGVSFNIAGGEKVGVVGRTGAGKTSLTLGLFRIIEAAGGKIVIDGEDISKMGLHTLRGGLTIIPQDPVLFSGTLRMNLDPFETLSDAEIWKALETAHLKTFVKSLTSGLNQEVSEGGENLSMGQRQLICLARALLRKSKILILDEATAAVDLETDDLIQRTIRNEFKDCTVLTIAHRLNTILDSDKVLVLHRGQIVEYDSPQVLLEDRGSLFYEMARDARLVN